MQQLQFEQAWAKAISSKDKYTIEQLFQETKEEKGTSIQCVPIREAFNHRRELLVTVLIHNFTPNALPFQKTNVQYKNNDITLEYAFTIEALVVPPFTSMPWTFIFPADRLPENQNLLGGVLVIGFGESV